MHDSSRIEISDELTELAQENDWTATEIPRERLDRWFGNCSFDDAMRKLENAGFKVGEYDKPSSFQIKQGVRRAAVGDKSLKGFNHPTMGLIGSFRALISLRDTNGQLTTEGRFYVDAP